MKEGLKKSKILSSVKSCEPDQRGCGLKETEAKQRLAQYGTNELAKAKKRNIVWKFLIYFKNPLLIILMVASIFSGFTGQVNSMIVILAMIFLSVILNFYQEYKSSKAVEAITKKLAITASVLRDGKVKDILAKLIVPGDVVLLSAGSIVPADGEIIEADDFFVNESVLTGESFPVRKNPKTGDNLVYSGTVAVTGFARFVVTKTGVSTEYGTIAKDLNSAPEVNAFEIGVKSFGFLIVKVIIGIVLLVFLISIFKTHNQAGFLQAFIFAIAIAVGVTPELLPMIISVNMARGSIKMAKNGVIVKRLSAIPDFGSMDILCTDKTGTLTKDKITLIRYLDVFGKESLPVLRFGYINAFFETGIKNMMDRAILEFKNLKLGKLKKIDEIPYDFSRKRSSIIYEEVGQRVMVTKGAPEEIMRVAKHYCCNGTIHKVTPIDLKKFNKVFEDLSAQGFGVLAIGYKKINDKKTNYKREEEDSDLIFTGFLAFFDPPKVSVKETLVFMKQHGVEIKILTGDNHLVTQKICEELDLHIKGVVVGKDLDINKLSHAALGAIAEKNTIFARLTPSQKEAIVLALRKRGHVVGYLGDGINDAPALKTADVGISVNNAVDVAKETADIILMKKGLQELMEGVLEGRKTFGNTMKYLMMGLSSNFGNMFSMIGAVMYLPFLPMLPGQILLNNFLYDNSQLTIPLDNVDEEYLKKPKRWDMKFIRNFMWVFGPISSLFDFITFYVLFGVYHLQGGAFQAGWFIESLATQIFVIYIIRTRQLPFWQSSPSRFLLISTLSAVTLAAILVISPLGALVGFDILPLKVLGTLFILVLAYLVLVEIVKRIFYTKMYPQNNL